MAQEPSVVFWFGPDATTTCSVGVQPVRVIVIVAKAF
jgi:hypothetical protein